jgi:hypothetical protein
VPEEEEEEEEEYFWRVERDRCVRLTTLPPSVSRLSKMWDPQHLTTLAWLVKTAFTLLLLHPGYVFLLKDMF